MPAGSCPEQGSPVGQASSTEQPSACWRDVYIGAAARGISYGGDFLAATALVLVLQSAGAGGYAVAALLIASALPPVVLAPLTGRLVDRFDSRVLLTGVGLGQAVCCALLAYAQRPVAIVGLVAVLAAGLAVTQPTYAALLPEMVGRDNLPRAMAIGQTAMSIGMLAGPALGGVLVGAYGQRVPLLVDAVTYLAIVAAGLAIRTRRVRGAAASAAAGNDSPPAAPVRTWRLRGDGLLRSLVVLVATTVAVINLVNVVEVFFVRETLGASPTAYGLVTAVWTAGMLIGAWLTAQVKGDDGVLAKAMVALFAASCAVIAVGGQAPTVGWLAALWLVGGLTNGGENTIIGVLMARRTPAPVRGRAFASLGAIANLANIAGYALGGALAGAFLPGTLISAAGLAATLVVAALSAPVWRAAARVRAEARVARPRLP